MGVDGWTLAVDFGTSFTSVAAMDVQGHDDFVEIDGQRWMPSTVFWQSHGTNGEGELLLGEEAMNAADRAPECLERCPKRRLGEEFMTLGTKRLPVTDAIAKIYRHAAEEARWRQGNEEPTEVRLTHPARWKGTRLAELFKAAEIAGFPQPVLVPEPVGAAVFFATEKAQVGQLQIGERVAVYDLGGGTFDTAVLARTADGFEVIGAPGGNEFLGGEDFDEALYRHLGEQLDEEQWQLLSSETSDQPWRRANLDFRIRVRRAKERLSRDGVTQATVQVASPVDRELTVSRSELESMIRADIEDTVERLKATIDEAPETSIENLRAIYLAGGSSRIPLVKQLIEENLGMEPDTLGDPKEVISRGAVRAVHLTAPGTEAPPQKRQRQRKVEEPPPDEAAQTAQPKAKQPRQPKAQEQPQAKAKPRQEKVTPPPPPPPKPAPAPAAGQTKLRTHFVFSIVSILLFWPTAIPAIVYASRARTKIAQNDVTGARRAGKLAFRWCMVSLVIFLGIVALAVIGSIAKHSSSSGSY